MHAAVVTSFDEPPAFGEFPVPTPGSANELLVDVVASGLHRRVRSQADGIDETGRQRRKAIAAQTSSDYLDAF
jgi:D-arabinose 1-dehydrogenase-like Zn-dependent alcohol dehydrogenase